MSEAAVGIGLSILRQTNNFLNCLGKACPLGGVTFKWLQPSLFGIHQRGIHQRSSEGIHQSSRLHEVRKVRPWQIKNIWPSSSQLHFEDFWTKMELWYGRVWSQITCLTDFTDYTCIKSYICTLHVYMHIICMSMYTVYTCKIMWDHLSNLDWPNPEFNGKYK